MVDHIRGGHIAVQGGIGEVGVDRAQFDAGRKKYCYLCGWWYPDGFKSQVDHNGQCPKERGHPNPFERVMPEDYVREETDNPQSERFIGGAPPAESYTPVQLQLESVRKRFGVRE